MKLYNTVLLETIPVPRVLARIFKMPVQNSNSKVSARPDLAFHLLEFLNQLNSIAYCIKKGNLHFSHIIENDLLGKYLVFTPKSQNWKFFIENFTCPNRFSGNWLSKRQAG